MSALAEPTVRSAKLSRRKRAAKTVDRALRGGLLGAAVAAVAWLAAVAIGGTAFVLLIVATIAVALFSVMRSDVKLGIWAMLAVGWAMVLLERALVNGHGGVWVGLAAWLGVILGARRAGLSKWSLPLLAYPLVCAAIVVAAGEKLLDPWGISWLWVAAVLGPVIGARTLLNPSPRQAPADKPA